MIEIAFVFTSVIVITGIFKMVGLIFGNSMQLPFLIPFTTVTPSHFLAWYPALGFQVWFWADKLGLFV